MRLPDSGPADRRSAMAIDQLRPADPGGYWSRGVTFDAWLAGARRQQDMWRGCHRRARVPDALVERAGRIGGRWRFLVIAEDWCGDAFNTIPFLQRFIEEVDGWELRLLRRDENPELMNRYLTDGARSIPIVIVLDDEGDEAAWWGPRPEELQAYFQENRAVKDKGDLYRDLRAWYARDHGRTTLCEVLDLLESEAEAAR